MQTKTYTGRLELLSDEPGAVRARFAKLNTVDLQGDVTLKGAFQDGQPVIVEPWNHDRAGLPVGRGVISEEGDQAVLTGRFFLDTVTGSEHYKTVKNMAELQEWSYSFDVLDHDYADFGGQRVRRLKRLNCIGVGPVTRGAGVETWTSKPWPGRV